MTARFRCLRGGAEGPPEDPDTKVSQISNRQSKVCNSSFGHQSSDRNGEAGSPALLARLHPEGFSAAGPTFDSWTMRKGKSPCAQRARQSPISAWEVFHRPAIARHFRPIYRALCAKLEKDLGRGILSRDFKMAVMVDPLAGFDRLGYCNHPV